MNFIVLMLQYLLLGKYHFPKELRLLWKADIIRSLAFRTKISPPTQRWGSNQPFKISWFDKSPHYVDKR